MTKQTGIATALLAAVALMGACEMGPELEVRTFALESLRGEEAARLVEPFVYNREPAIRSGHMTGTDGAITVRETADNLDQIERVLAEFDKPRSDVRLHFQIIEADGFTESDARIAAVEEELRKIFQFRGYRLAGEGFVTATDGGGIQQAIRVGEDAYAINGHTYWAGPGTVRLDEISMYNRTTGDDGLVTTVNIRPGQTLVLGSSPKFGSTATLLLTVRAEEVPGTND